MNTEKQTIAKPLQKAIPIRETGPGEPDGYFARERIIERIGKRTRNKRWSVLTRAVLLSAFCFLLSRAEAATVYGRLIDVTGSALETKLTFNPTNVVVISSGALLIGGPKTVTASSTGWFTNNFECGDYWVRSQLQNWRTALLITVPCTTNSYNITNLTDTAITYVATGRGLQYDDGGDGDDLEYDQ